MSFEETLDLLRSKKELYSNASPARDRLTQLFDENSFSEIDVFLKADDSASGVIIGYGTIEGNIVYAFSQDKTSSGGAVGKAHSKKIVKVYELAAKTGAPVIGIYDSNGANINEGQQVLSSYGDILNCANKISGVVPTISVVVGTCAGISAMVACNSDVLIMSKDSEIFVTSPFTTLDSDKGSGSAQNAALSGVAQIIADDEKDAIVTARKTIGFFPANNLSVVPVYEFEENRDIKEIISANLNEEKLNIISIIQALADKDSVVELSKDFGDSTYTAFATIGGMVVGIVTTVRRDGQSFISKDGSAKMARFVRLCDSFSIPVLTFADVDGFAPSSQQELAGSVREASKLSHVFSEATCTKITVITGQAIGSAFVALCGTGAGSDMVFAWPKAVISPLKPETAVAFLWNERLSGSQDPINDRMALITEYKETLGSAFEACENGCVDDVINPLETRSILINALDLFSTKRQTRLPKKHSNMPL